MLVCNSCLRVASDELLTEIGTENLRMPAKGGAARGLSYKDDPLLMHIHKMVLHFMPTKTKEGCVVFLQRFFGDSNHILKLNMHSVVAASTAPANKPTGFPKKLLLALKGITTF
jgi:hypothetical protein